MEYGSKLFGAYITVLLGILFGALLSVGLLAFIFTDQADQIKEEVALISKPNDSEDTYTLTETCYPEARVGSYKKYELGDDGKPLNPVLTMAAIKCSKQMDQELERCRAGHSDLDIHWKYSLKGGLDIGVNQVFDNGICTFFKFEYYPTSIIEKQGDGRKYLIPAMSYGDYTFIPFVISDSKLIIKRRDTEALLTRIPSL